MTTHSRWCIHFILPFDSVPTETFLPLARFACGETTTTSPSFNPCFISISVSVSWPDDANALNDTFSDCPHIGFAFLTSDGTFRNCDTQLLCRLWLIFQEAHFDTHFGFNN